MKSYLRVTAIAKRGMNLIQLKIRSLVANKRPVLPTVLTKISARPLKVCPRIPTLLLKKIKINLKSTVKLAS